MFGLKERRAGPRTEEHADTQARRLGIGLIFYFVLPILILFLVYRLEFRQINDTDVMDMATVARNMSGGHFTTSAVRPLYFTLSRDVFHMPDPVHAPLYPAALMWFLALGASDLKVFLTSALFFWLTLPVLFFLSRGMFNQKVALLTLFAYMTSTFMMNMLLHAGSGTLAAFLFTSLCLVLFRYAQAAADAEEIAPDMKGVLRTAGFAGVLMALCYLTDYMLLFALLPVAAFVYLTGGRARKAGLGVFLVAFLVPAGIWWIRNLMIGVNPFFGMRSLEIAMGTTDHPGLSLYRVADAQSLFALLQEVKGDVGRKFFYGLAGLYQSLPSFGQPYLAGFFLVGLFYSFRRIGVNAIRGMVLGAFVCVIVFSSLFALRTASLGDSLAAFFPVLTAFAVAYFVRLLTDARLPQTANRALMTGAVILLAFPLLSALAFTRPPAVSHEVEVDVAHRVAPGVPVLTDRVSQMAWYGGRTSVWLPYTEKDFKTISGISKPKVICLTRALPNEIGQNDGPWINIYNNAYSVQPPRTRDGIIPYAVHVKGSDTSSLAGFELYRGMTDDAAKRYVNAGVLLFAREGGLREETQ